jgi:biotin carboxylase
VQHSLYLTALNPTDSVTDGFLPAAAKLGLRVVLLTDQPDAHRAAYLDHPAPPAEIVRCAVRDAQEVIATIAEHGVPQVIFSNSDHLQTPTALAAVYFGLPAKDWRATLRAKNKREMRRHLRDETFSTTVLADQQLPTDLTFPLVVKPREGVASENVVLTYSEAELEAAVTEIRRRHIGPLVLEQYLPGELRTLDTIGDGTSLHVLGSFRTQLSPPPYFIEERLTFDAHPDPVLTAQVLDQLRELGVGFGVCHTEFVAYEGNARLIEVNYRNIGDQVDFSLSELVGLDMFEYALRVHGGELLANPLPLRANGSARIEYPCVTSTGTLVAAPQALDYWHDEATHVTYQPTIAVGTYQELTHTNRDYAGILRVTGTDRAVVDAVADKFLADNSWEVAA